MPTQTRSNTSSKKASTTSSSSSTPAPGSTLVEDNEEGVEVGHGSSAQGLEQKHGRTEATVETSNEDDSTDPVQMDIDEDVTQVQEKKKKKKKKDEEGDSETEVQMQLMSRMLEHMNNLGVLIDKLDNRLTCIEERERTKRNHQRDGTSSSHGSNMLSKDRLHTPTRKAHRSALSRSERQPVDEMIRETVPRRKSQSENDSLSDARRPVSRARARRERRRSRATRHSHRESMSRSRSRGSLDGDSVSSTESTQLMQILQTFAESQRAASTRHRDSDEKALTYLAKHRLLSDRTEGKEIQWLLNLNMLREQREWSDKRYCTFLPRLWNPQAKSSITRFFLNLDPSTSRDRIELDKAFIEEFAAGGIAKLLETATHASQPEDSTCKEFLENVQFATRALNKWYPEAVPNESYVIQTLSQRFTSAEMLKRLAYARKRKQNLSLESLEDMVVLADEHDRIERRAGTNRILRINMRMDQAGLAPNHSMSSASIRSIIDDTQSCVAEPSECIEDMLLTMAATETIYSHNGTPTVRALSKVMDRIQRPPPIATLDVKDVHLKGAVCNGPLKNTDNGNHICIWHSLKGTCNLPEGKCRHPHVARKREMCKVDQKETCTKGGYCPYRHRSDEYEVLFYDRRSKKYKKYLWKDRTSPFSMYYKHK